MASVLCRTCAVLTLLSALVSSAVAQTGVTISGRLVNSLSGEPVGDVPVSLDELQRSVRAASDGTFTFEGVPPGTYHVSVKAQGFSPRRTEIMVGTTPVTTTIAVDPELHYTEVVSVSPEPRSPFESYQPTAVLAGQLLTQQIDASLGQTLERQPGVAARSFGPAPSRPVIRGLDGDRVLILQDGQRVGDLSSQSGDHAVAINPATADRIEVVRGPATLLYGANAIGGLVNVITEQVPTRPITGSSGSLVVDGGTGAREGGAAGEIAWGDGTLAVRVGGGGRRSGDVVTPEGRIANTQARTGFGTAGLSWTTATGYLGGSYGYDDTRHGVPIVEGGSLQLTPRRHALSLRAGAQGLTGLFDSVRGALGYRRYSHDEVEGDVVGTTFTNNTLEVEAMGSHRPVRRLKGSIGGSFHGRAFEARGEEALSPAVDERGFALFAYEELAWPHLTFQFGGRVERTSFDPLGEASRRFTTVSGSLGLLARPAAARDALTLALSVARAARNPALEELFFFGPHHGNFAFEIGNPDLDSEKALGIDASVRWRSGRASGEVTYFRNDISDYIFRRVLDHAELEARAGDFMARFAGRPVGDPGEEEPSLLLVEFVGADSLFQGVEAHADFQLTGPLSAELGVDYVRASLEATGEPLPRIPPFRLRTGLRFQQGAFQGGGELVTAARQDRVSGAETSTAGYGILKLFSSYSFQRGRAVSTLTARLDNATNTLYRNHLSLIKDLVPEMGRSFKVLYDVRF